MLFIHIDKHLELPAFYYSNEKYKTFSMVLFNRENIITWNSDTPTNNLFSSLLSSPHPVLSRLLRTGSCARSTHQQPAPTPALELYVSMFKPYIEGFHSLSPNNLHFYPHLCVSKKVRSTYKIYNRIHNPYEYNSYIFF